ncbi:MAG: hypothetical protein CME72_03635 [Halomonadaceae bacterium]|nr:hypothetical protein [Halomonadaceae bacterium]
MTTSSGYMPPALSDGPASRFVLSRRSLLKHSLGVGAIPLMPGLALAQQGNEADAPFERFMRLSRQLTTRAGLDEEQGKRLFDVLSRHWVTLDDDLAYLDEAFQADTVSLTTAHRSVANRLLSAWYTGVVGKMPKAELVTYQRSLMFDAVSDVLVIRSYCPNRPGYWAEEPPSAALSASATTASTSISTTTKQGA